jgi:hypothetical protein
MPTTGAQVKSASTRQEQAEICAQTSLQIDQSAVMTRKAVGATLEIYNDTPDPLEDLSVTLSIYDAQGRLSNEKFVILPPVLTGITPAGTPPDTNVFDVTRELWRMPGNSTGRSRWVILPRDEAAPDGPTEYSVGGYFGYVAAGIPVDNLLVPTPVKVYPNPRLRLKYFHQRDVVSDDPFTPELEPAEPFPLAVVVQNVGNGAARNFSITSAQPQITENVKGLQIDFEIVGTEVAGQEVTPALTASFGDVGPGEIKIANWLFKTPLQGFFRDYKATFEHDSALGGRETSLIESVDIHELIHLVHAQGTFDDGKPDFLVNDVKDERTLPDTLYLSDGTTNSVAAVLGGTFGHQYAFYSVGTDPAGNQELSPSASDAQTTVSLRNTAPALPELATLTIDEGVPWSQAIIATDTDTPAQTLTYRLTAGPPGAVLDPTTGLLTWTPSESQGPSTNLSLRVQVSDFRLAPVSIQPAAGSSHQVSMRSLGGGAWVLTVAAAPGRFLGGTNELARLAVATVPSALSGFVRLQVSEAKGQQPSGAWLLRPATQDGRVAVIGEAPLLEAQAHDGHRSLILYGRPWSSYAVQSAARLSGEVQWTLIQRIPLTNTFKVLPLAHAGSSSVYYRAQDYRAEPPVLEIGAAAPSRRTLLAFGVPGRRYTLQQATSLHPPISWLPATQIQLTNGFQLLNLPNPASTLFYRLRTK